MSEELFYSVKKNVLNLIWLGGLWTTNKQNSYLH